MTRYVFGREGRSELARLAAGRALLVLDFDGTLAPIVVDRDRARLPATTRRRLIALAKLYPVAVVSGRARADVAARLAGVPLRAIVGNHGAEDGSADAPSPRVRRWRQKLEADFADLPGVEIEDKGGSLSVHYRRATDHRKAFRAVASAVDRLAGVRRVDGHAVVNVVPKNAPHKGTAVRRLRRELGADEVLFVGDDVTDEDAFALAGPGLLGVRVGPSRTTAASHHLKDQREMDTLLDELVRLRKARPVTSLKLPTAALALSLALPACDHKAPPPASEQSVAPPAAVPAPSAAPSASSAPTARKPLNVILIFVDSLRGDVSWTGYPRETTPRIDAFRKKHCVAYANGYSLSSYTAKSVVPALVGEYPSAMRRDAYFFTRYPDADNLFISERAQAAGHRTLSTHAHGYFLPKFFTQQGFDVHRTLPGGVDLKEVSSVTSEPLTDLTREVLGDAANTQPSGGKRFFAFAHYMDPHHTYERHKGFQQFGKRGRDLYDHEVLYTDHWIGELLDFVQKQPWWSETAVIISSDHGEGFGERDHNRHGHELWESIIRVPWLVCMPGVKPRIVSDVRRSQIDLAPTIADLMGLPATPPFRGKSLVDEVLGHEPATKRRVIADQPRADLMDRRRAVIDGDWKIVGFGDDKAFFLFDLAKDPWEANDLAASRPDKLAEMKRIYQEESKKIPLVEVDRGPDLKGAPRGRRW